MTSPGAAAAAGKAAAAAAPGGGSGLGFVLGSRAHMQVAWAAGEGLLRGTVPAPWHSSRLPCRAARPPCRNLAPAAAPAAPPRPQEAAVAKRSAVRNFLMHGFHLLVMVVVGNQIRDTQCGFKVRARLRAQQRAG